MISLSEQWQHSNATLCLMEELYNDQKRNINKAHEAIPWQTTLGGLHTPSTVQTEIFSGPAL